MTTQHVAEELPGLLTGDAPRSVVLAAAEHLRDCEDCQQDLVSAVVAHASLVSAHRHAPGLVASADGDAASDTSGADIPRRSIVSLSDASPGASEDDEPSAASLPDLSSVFRRAHEESAADAGRPAAAQVAPRRRWLVGVAAAAVLLVGGGAAGAVVASSSGSSAPGGATFALEPFGVGHQAATATVDGGTVRVDAARLPRLDGHHVYELWVTNSARTRMQPVGVIGNDNTAELTVSPKVLDRYTDFEVSVQPVSSLEPYSRLSVLRGAYA